MYHPWIQVLGFLLIPALIFFTPRKLEDILHLVFSGIFLMIILNVVGNSKSWFQIHHPILEYLGKISYGFYMYHVLCISFTLHMLDKLIGLNRDISTPEHLLLYGISFGLTILVSSLSYHFIEKPFIRYKDNTKQPISISKN
jgi:peptidoglycan/LPS O-acetylase OafA/YrhL